MPNKSLLSKPSNMAAAFAAGAALLIGPAMGPAMAQVAQQTTAQTTLAANAAERTPQVLAAGTTAEANYQTLYVNPTAGDDSAQGIENQPLQTVTKALELATPNTVIVLASGRYTQTTGEVFPLQLKSGVTIQGTPGDRNRTAIIEGGGNFQSPLRSQQNAAIIAADRAGIAQVAISNPNGYGVWVESTSPTILEAAFVGNHQTGLYVAEGSPRIENSYFSGNQVAGLIIFGQSNASIRDNIFEGTGDAIRVMEGATPNIVGNRMTNNEAGLVVIGNARPVLRNNHISGNRRNDVVEVTATAEDIASPTALALAEESTRLGNGAISESRAEPTVPEAADAIPGERIGHFALSPLQPTVQMASNPAANRSINLQTSPRSRVREVTPELEADAIPGLASPAPEAASDVLPRMSPGEETLAISAPTELPAPPLTTAAAAAAAPVAPASRPRTNLLNALPTTPGSLPTAAATPIAIVPAAEPVSRSLANEPLAALEADIIETDIIETDIIETDELPIQSTNQPAGAPGAALAALRSGVPMASRAANDGNPESFRIRRRRRQTEAEVQPEDRPAAPARPAGNNRLAVPSSEIPIGSGGSSVIFSAPSSGVGAPPAYPSRAQALGLYYRVFVEASDPFIQDDVKDIVPDAFRTNFEGRSVMQVGAFPTEEEAEERRRLLEDNGLDVRIEYIR